MISKANSGVHNPPQRGQKQAERLMPVAVLGNQQACLASAVGMSKSTFPECMQTTILMGIIIANSAPHPCLHNAMVFQSGQSVSDANSYDTERCGVFIKKRKDSQKCTANPSGEPVLAQPDGASL